jgi:hypothetical protein
MNDDTIEIGDTFEHEAEPGRAWEVTERIALDLFRVRSGDKSRIVRGRWLRGRWLLSLASPPSGWRRCEARAVCA